MRINRRQVVHSLVMSGVGLATGQPSSLAQQAKPADVIVGDLAKFEKEFDSIAFVYEATNSLAVRIPAPREVNERMLEVDKKIFLTAYTLTCMHQGCETGVLNSDHVLICPCHDSMYDADGTVIQGPTKKALQALKLELKDGKVHAVGRIGT
jgi:Rieske Fe-S protein